MCEIDLGKYKSAKSRVFSGRLEANVVRKKINLDILDKNDDEVVNITIPTDIISLNSSFFLGLFGPSVRFLGEQKFREKYVFECTDIIKRSVNDGIERALKTSNPLDF